MKQQITKMYEHVGNHKQKYKSKKNNKNQYNYIKINKYKKKHTQL